MLPPGAALGQGDAEARSKGPISDQVSLLVTYETKGPDGDRYRAHSSVIAWVHPITSAMSSVQ